MGRSTPRCSQDAQSRLQRDMRPGRPVGQFVFDFVKRLFKQEEVEQFPASAPRRPATSGRRRAFRGSSPNRPRIRRSPQARMRCASAARSSGLRFGRAVDSRAGRVVDRAQEAGDVARRRRLAPALFERAARLALEIEDIGVVLGDQHLAEMEVAVMADLQCRRSARPARFDVPDDGVAMFEQALRQIARSCRASRHGCVRAR